MHMTITIYHCVLNGAVFELLSRADVCIPDGESVQPARKGDPLSESVRTGLVDSFGEVQRTCSQQCHPSCVSLFSGSTRSLTTMILGVKVMRIV